MHKLKRGLALLLVALMLITTLPATAMAAELSDGDPPETVEAQPDAGFDDMMSILMETGVLYTAGADGGMVLVVEPQYADWCGENRDALLTAGWFTGIQYFSEDGSYTIQLPEGTAFPCEIMFQWMDMGYDDEPIVTFADVDGVRTVNGHSFSVACENPQYTEDGEPEEADFNAGVNPLGYQYIKTVTKEEVDLTSYLKEELKTLPLSTLLPDVNLSNVSALAVEKSPSTGGDGDYIVVETRDNAIDLSSLRNSSTQTSELQKDMTFVLEIINSDDQLNKNATRYIVPIKLTNLAALFTLDAYKADGTQINTVSNDWKQDDTGYRLYADMPIWDVNRAKVSLKLDTTLPTALKKDLTANVYEGAYETAEEAADSGSNITGQIWNQAAKSGYVTDWAEPQDFTIVLTRNGQVAQVMNLTIALGAKGVDFGFDVATVANEEEETESEEIEIDTVSFSNSSNGKAYYRLFPTDFETWSTGEAKLKLRYKNRNEANTGIADYNDYADLTDVTVYTGYYETEEELNIALTTNRTEDITEVIWAEDGEGYTADYTLTGNDMQTFTVVVKEKGQADIAYLRAFGVVMSAERSYSGTTRVSPSDVLSIAQQSDSYTYTSYINATDRRKNQPDTPNTHYYTMLYPSAAQQANGIDFPATGKYYVTFSISDDTKGGNSKTGLANISSIKDEKGTDLKSKLFNANGIGTPYLIDFADDQLVIFTVTYTDGTTQEIRLRTIPATPVKKEDSLSIDTYFNVTGVKGFDTYVMPPHVDSSYQNGFQVIFVNATKEQLESAEITPLVSTGSGVRMYHKHNESGDPILLRDVELDPVQVTSGVPELFSAASESGTHLRNYWITFIAKDTTGAKLWVNGQDDVDHLDKVTGYPTREVYLNYGTSGGYYDIFFANVGNADLTNLKVELSENANIRLDDYWTIGDTKTLAPFTTTKIHQTNSMDDPYSQLENMAKIRIWPKEDTARGDIDAILTISADGQEPVSLKLTGKVGQAAIISSEVPDGVMYVPYSCLIQTNFQYRTASDSNRPTFRIVRGTLPAGLSIYEKIGEIYGVPKAWGTFNFTVGIYQGGQMVDSRDYSMVIADNTDVNVWNASDETYEVLDEIGLGGDESTGEDWVINLQDEEYLIEENRTFISEGPYLYYVKVFLDGRLLTPDEDYTHDEGSTKIVLDEDTLKGNNTNGTHTLAIEFRESDTQTSVDDQTYEGTLKRTSQNYTIEGGINPTTSSGSGSGSGNGSGGSSPGSRPSTGGGSGSKPGTSGGSGSGSGTPSTTPSTSNNGFPFTDVRTGNWFYNDVYWTWDNEIMNGVSSTLFAPNDPISQSMIVVVLARLVNVDLTQFANTTVAGAAPGMWYTEAAAWAQQSGILPDNSSFSSEGALSRDGMAIMLVKYMSSMGIDTSVGSSITFADSDQMSDAGRNAFQVLYQYGIFNGVGENRMDPTGFTTRAQFAALVHRVSNFVTAR